MAQPISETARKVLARGAVIPACPLALNSAHKLDERRQRALVRYYSAAGAGGLAVGVHTTEFKIRHASVGLFEPVLALAAEELKRSNITVRIGGICGATAQALTEAHLLSRLEYHAGLLSLGALQDASEDELIEHCCAVAEVIPIIGFYLQPAAGGRRLPYSFWRRFAEIPNAAAIKIAPFNRYHALDVIRAVADSRREDIALYTGNDDNIVIDLLTRFRFVVNGKPVERRIVGGLLGQWAVWTRQAVALLNDCALGVTDELLLRNVEITDANAAIFDAAHGFSGCLPGIHEVLRRQGLLEGVWCLDPNETLSRGQAAEIDRVYKAYPHLNDDAFVREHLDDWLRP